jgi:hypothetical protein
LQQGHSEEGAAESAVDRKAMIHILASTYSARVVGSGIGKSSSHSPGFR